MTNWADIATDPTTASLAAGGLRAPGALLITGDLLGLGLEDILLICP